MRACQNSSGFVAAQLLFASRGSIVSCSVESKLSLDAGSDGAAPPLPRRVLEGGRYPPDDPPAAPFHPPYPPFPAPPPSPPPVDSTNEGLSFPDTRTVFYYYTDSAPARWLMFKNAYFHSLRVLSPLEATIHVLCYDDAAHALCHGLTHGDRHVACMNLEARMPQRLAEQHVDGETPWFGDKWKHFVDGTKPKAVQRILSETVRSGEGPFGNGTGTAYRFCLSDTDAVLLADPLPYIRRTPYAITADNATRGNSGFFCADVRSTIATAIIKEYIHTCAAKNYSGWCASWGAPAWVIDPSCRSDFIPHESRGSRPPPAHRTDLALSNLHSHFLEYVPNTSLPPHPAHSLSHLCSPCEPGFFPIDPGSKGGSFTLWTRRKKSTT